MLKHVWLYFAALNAIFLPIDDYISRKSCTFVGENIKGTWIDHSPEAIDQIIVEFDLPREKTIVKKASHWDIGQTWND